MLKKVTPSMNKGKIVNLFDKVLKEKQSDHISRNAIVKTQVPLELVERFKVMTQTWLKNEKLILKSELDRSSKSS